MAPDALSVIVSIPSCHRASRLSSRTPCPWGEVRTSLWRIRGGLRRGAGCTAVGATQPDSNTIAPANSRRLDIEVLLSRDFRDRPMRRSSRGAGRTTSRSTNPFYLSQHITLAAFAAPTPLTLPVPEGWPRDRHPRRHPCRRSKSGVSSRALLTRMPGESLDAPENLSKEPPCQVALSQLLLLNRTVLPICSMEVSPHGDFHDEQKGSSAGRVAQGRAGRTHHERPRSESVAAERAAV